MKRGIITGILVVGVVAAGLLIFLARRAHHPAQPEHFAPAATIPKPAGTGETHRVSTPAPDRQPEATNRHAITGGLPTSALTPQTDNRLLLVALDSLVQSDQRKAVGELFQRKRSLSDAELLEFWSKLRAIATDATLDPQFRADTIWVLAGIGMLAKERGILTEQDVETQCAFLADVAGQEATDLRVRRVALKALGDLHVTNGIPILTALLSDPTKWNTPELVRPASIAIATLTPTQAIHSIAPILTSTTNSAVADTAAYALGLTGDPATLPMLVANRGRLGDNLSVDNAIQALSSNVFATLSDHRSPYLDDAIRATRSLWKTEQQEQFIPLLLQVLQDSAAAASAREAALTRLLDHASTLPLEQEKQLLSQIQPLVQKGTGSAAATNDIARRLRSTVLQPIAIKKHIQEDAP